MNNEHYEQLSGRIEGLACFILGLTAQLEMTGMIDGIQLTDRLRVSANLRSVLNHPEECTVATRQMLIGMIEELEAMRRIRQQEGR